MQGLASQGEIAALQRLLLASCRAGLSPRDDRGHQQRHCTDEQQNIQPVQQVHLLRTRLSVFSRMNRPFRIRATTSNNPYGLLHSHTNSL